jgi:anti-anti-sigma factor
MRDTTDLKGAMALGLDVSRTDDVAVVRCRGRIVFGEEADELRRVVLGLLNETQRIVLNLLWIEDIDSSGLGTLVASLNRTLLLAPGKIWVRFGSGKRGQRIP